MTVHSTDLQWQLVRRNNKFLQVRNGIRLSNDPFNNSGRCTRRHAGFIAEKVAVVKVKGEKQLSLTTKDGSADNANKPRKMFKTQVFETNAKASAVSKAAAAVRPDLADMTFRRARKLAKTLAHQQKVRVARKAHCATLKHKRTNKKVRKAKQ